jgi:hypothetical protein
LYILLRSLEGRDSMDKLPGVTASPIPMGPCRCFSWETVLKVNHIRAQTTRAGASQTACPAALLHAISFGLVLPPIFFVNDLSHPLQTGLLFSLFPAGRIVGQRVFGQANARSLNSGPLLLQGAMLLLTYLLIAGSAELHPTGITALRLAQLAWLMVGLFGANFLFRPASFDESHAIAMIDISALGVPLGALFSAALTWRLVRSSERYDLGGFLVPALVAASFSALAVLLVLPTGGERLGFERRDGAQPKERYTSKRLRDAFILGSSDLHRAIGVSGCAAAAVAIVCTLTPMLLWETFGFSQSGVALMIGKAGLFVIGARIVVRRALRRSIAPAADVAAIGLLLLGTSAGLLMWAPGTGSGYLVFAGIVTAMIGWGCLQVTLFSSIDFPREGQSREERFTSNGTAQLLAWMVGSVLSASIFYAHERTSFGLSGIAIALAAMPLAALRRRNRLDAARAVPRACAESAAGGAISQTAIEAANRDDFGEGL